MGERRRVLHRRFNFALRNFIEPVTFAHCAWPPRDEIDGHRMNLKVECPGRYSYDVTGVAWRNPDDVTMGPKLGKST